MFGIEVPVARGLRARLLGLALLDREAAGPGLLIPRSRAVHTFGMRFPLDVAFLDAHGRVLAVRRGVPPRRFLADRRAVFVAEFPAGLMPRCFSEPGPGAGSRDLGPAGPTR